MNRKTIFLTIIFSMFFTTLLFSADNTNKNSLKSVRLEYKKLQQWEETLKQKEDIIKEMELSLIKEQSKLKEIMNKTSKILTEIKKIRDANVKSLATVYSKMKPEDSSQIVNAMDVDLAVKIFLKMQPNKIAKILNLVNREKAVKITGKLALYGVKLNVGAQK